MIRAFAAVAVAVVVVVVTTTAVAAEPQRPRGAFGLGLSVGDPTGITAELYPRSPGVGQAVEVTLGLDAFDDNNVYAHVQWKYYVADLVRGAQVDIPVYLGIGPWIADYGDIAVGARAPFGAAFEFKRAPIQVFLELALYVAVIADDSGDAGVGAALGFRYFF
jgi:hypothetical protein